MSRKKFNLQRRATKEKGEQAMENNKGITLVSLIGYVILSMLVISILTVITANFRKNFNELDVQAVQDIEFDKINMQISKEIREGKELDIDNVMANEIAFIEGNKYTYVSNEKALYMNDKVVIAEHLTNCSFSIENNEILRVMAQIEGKNRVMEYALVNKYVARIKDEYYVTLQSAIDAVPSNDAETTITVLTDVVENVVIEKNKNIILELSTWTVKNKEEKPVIRLSGKLKILNGKITSNSIEKFPTIWIEKDASLTVVGGTIKSEKYIALGNLGTIEIDGTSIIDAFRTAISNREEAKATIKGGELISRNGNTINNFGIVEISGTAKINGNIKENDVENGYPTIYNQITGSVIITGGRISSNSSNTIHNSGILNISGNSEVIGTNKNDDINEDGVIMGTPTIYNKMGTVTIEGGLIKSTNIQAVTNTSEGTTVIIGGTFISETSDTISNAGNMEIKENVEIVGTLENIPTIANKSGGSLIIEGKIRSNSYAIVNKGETEIRGNAELEGKKTDPTVYNYSGGKITIAGGNIKNTSIEPGVAIRNQVEGTIVIIGGTITSENSNVINNYGNIEVKGTANITRMATNDATFVNRAGAIAKITGGNISSSAVIAIWNNEGATTTITGGNISSTDSNVIYNEGTLELGGTSIIEGGTNIDSKPAIYNRTNAIANITGGTINGNLSRAIYSEQTSILNISDGNITSSNKYTVISKGTMTITGGTIKNTNIDNYAVYNWASEGGTCTFSGATIVGKTYGI